MPTIQYYIKGSKVGEVVGADWGQIESLVQKHYKAGDVWGSAGSGHTLGGGGGSTAAEPAAGGASGGGLLSGISSYIWGSSKPAANVVSSFCSISLLFSPCRSPLSVPLVPSKTRPKTKNSKQHSPPPSNKTPHLQTHLPSSHPLANPPKSNSNSRTAPHCGTCLILMIRWKMSGDLSCQRHRG